jgi:hypothetical protein
MQLRKHLDKLTDEGKEAFENRLISSGKLLPPKKGRTSKVTDPFDSTFQELVADNPNLINPSASIDQDTEREKVLDRIKERKPPKR